MLRFVVKPHLPQGRVSQLILGEKYKSVLEDTFFSRNIEPIWLENNDFVDVRLSGHCDLMAAHLGNNVLAVQEGAVADCENIHNIELIRIPAPTKPEYPHDVALNFCIVGDKLIYNPKTADASVIDRLKLNLLACRQGYTKCSVCVVDEASIITADNKIAQIALGAGMSVLYVKEDLAALDGFEHGFIGGASFKISRNEMAFTGVINDADEKRRIESFLNERGINAVYLTSERLFDIGSAIPIIEEID